MLKIGDIDLKLLRIFVAVADAKGFASAQSALGLSPSTISIRVKELEERIGFKLCSRGRAGFKLTDLGRLFLEEGRHLLQLMNGFVSRVTSLESGLNGTLNLGVVDALVTEPRLPLPRVLGELSRHASGLFIELKVAPRPQLELLVLDGQLDAGIGPFPKPLAGLRRRSLFIEEHHVYCGRGHRLFDMAAGLHDPGELAEHPIVLRSYAEEFDLHKFGPARVMGMTDSIEGVLTLVLSGQYLGYLPAHYASQWVKEEAIRPIPLRTLSYRSQHSLLTRDARQRKPTLDGFVSLLMQRIKEL